jgi:hypothetical protein
VQAARKLAPEERLLSMRFLAGLGLQASRRTLPGVPESAEISSAWSNAASTCQEWLKVDN